VILDAKHPLAGKTLNFEVTVGSIREASPEELATVDEPVPKA
jgi:FKBP-type peptidyl-prolyl cis-trans isomerase 2